MRFRNLAIGDKRYAEHWTVQRPVINYEDYKMEKGESFTLSRGSKSLPVINDKSFIETLGFMYVRIL